MFLKPCNKILNRICELNRHRVSFFPAHFSSKTDYRIYYSVLGLNPNCSEDDVKEAFLTLAKKYHPDSHLEADPEKFLIVEDAYRKLQEKFSTELETVSLLQNSHDDGNSSDNRDKKSEEFDIEHSAPQHRQYLNYEGIGQGTPFQREKQYQKYQVAKAVENVYNHRLSQIPNTENTSLVIKDAKASKKTKTRYGIDRLVEDLIQESMAKGEFTNLKGTGKPLENQNHNPYIDIVTHKINQVLIDNGFSPQWIMLEKEIRGEIVMLKQKLKDERMKLGKIPLNPIESLRWEKILDMLANDEVKMINKKINDYNLIVPLLSKQMVHVNLRKMSETFLKDSPSKFDSPVLPKIEHQHSQQPESGFFDLINFIKKSL